MAGGEGGQWGRSACVGGGQVERRRGQVQREAEPGAEGDWAPLWRDFKWDKVTGKLPTELGAPGVVLGPSRASDSVPGAVGTQLTSSLQHTCEVDLSIFSTEQ